MTRQVQFGCGCRCSEDADGPSLYWCPVHAVAHDLLAACEAVVKALDYRDCSPDPTKPNYVNPAVVAADRSIAEEMARAAVAKAKE